MDRRLQHFLQIIRYSAPHLAVHLHNRLQAEEDHLILLAYPGDPLSFELLAERNLRIRQAAQEAGFSEIIVREEPVGGSGFAQEAVGDPRTEIDVELVEFDPARRGWVATPHYAIRFWLPLLGRGPWLLWLILRSYGWGGGPATPSIATLAATLGCSRQQLIGRERRRDGRRYWQRGWMEVLRDEGILRWKQDSHGRYRFYVREVLPLLTPEQVARLPAGLQEAHARWLRQAELDEEAWEQIPISSLLEQADQLREEG